MASRGFEIAGATAFLGLAAAGWLASADLPEASRLFPRFALATLGLAAAAWLAGSVFHDRAEGEAAGSQGSAGRFRLVGAFAINLAYAVAVVTLGYFVSTVVYIPLMARFLGHRGWIVAIATAVAYAIVAYVLFVVLFARPVPF